MGSYQSPAPSGHHGTHALVVGGSIAGLVAARVLSEHFDQVTLVERDDFPLGSANRKGVPQGRHVHGLLARGLTLMVQLFPDLGAALTEGGAVPFDLANDVRWYHVGGYRVRYPSGLVSFSMSRPFLERLIRSRVLARTNLTCRAGCEVLGLVANAERTGITGVRVQSRTAGSTEELLLADLIVDATGRGSRSPHWLAHLGYPPPEETVIRINAGYTSRIYRRTPEDLPGAKASLILPTPPHEQRAGALVPIEEDRWLASLAGWLGDHAPATEEGYLAFARSLPVPDIERVISRAEPLTDFAVYKFPSNLRRHYEKLARVPAGYLVLGDALCSFNPIYGQGMTVAALEAQVLDACLRDPRGGQAVPQRFYRAVTPVLDVPWALAAGGDFNYPAVEGRRVPGTQVMNWYVRKVQRAMRQDAAICQTFLAVANLMQPVSRLFAPRILYGVLRASASGRHGVG